MALSRTIPAVDYELFSAVAEVKGLKDAHLLVTWYEYDENAVPPVYVFKVPYYENSTYYLRQGGNVFAGVCLFFCLCVRKITPKVTDGSF